jgi:hypothetical protein
MRDAKFLLNPRLRPQINLIFGQNNINKLVRTLKSLKLGKSEMKKNIIAAAMVCTAIATASTSASAQVGKSVIGPSLIFGSGSTNIGIDSKFGLSDNISVRPAIYFGNGATIIGAGLTYDFDLKSASANRITPYAGGFVFTSTGGGSSATAGITAGADFDLNESIQLKGGVLIPITNGGGNTAITLGAGFKF